MTFKIVLALIVSVFSMNSFAQWDVLNDYMALSYKDIKYFFNSDARNLNDLQDFKIKMEKSEKLRAKAIKTVTMNFTQALNKLEAETSAYENRYPNNRNLIMFFDSLNNAAAEIARDQLKIMAKISPRVKSLREAYTAKVEKVVTLDPEMQDIYWRGEKELSQTIKRELQKIENLLYFVMMKDGEFSRYQKLDDLAIFSIFLTSHKGFMRERMGTYMKDLPPILKYRSEIISEYGRVLGRHPHTLPPIMFNLKLDRSCEDGETLASKILWENLSFAVYDGVFRFNNVKVHTVMDAIAAIMKNDSVRVVCDKVWLDSSIGTVYSRRDNTIYFNYKYDPVGWCPDGHCRSPYIFSKGMVVK